MSDTATERGTATFTRRDSLHRHAVHYMLLDSACPLLHERFVPAVKNSASDQFLADDAWNFLALAIWAKGNRWHRLIATSG